MIIVAMQGYAVKRVPKMIRGIVMSLIICFSGIGGILYLQISKVLFDDMTNFAVYGLIGIFDAIVLVFILAMILMGKYGDVAPQEDTFGEGNSQKNEGATADFIKDHEFDDNIPDVPLNYELYNEQIPEMSSDREASSFHTRRFTKARRRSMDEGDSFDSENQDIIGSIRAGDNAYAPNTITKGSYVHD